MLRQSNNARRVEFRQGVSLNWFGSFCSDDLFSPEIADSMFCWGRECERLPLWESNDDIPFSAGPPPIILRMSQ